ncbi:MAG: OsmC family protein [Atopostipes suicloacalis]|nr:OsmC family protein [Atopostipes suicloacalis]
MAIDRMKAVVESIKGLETKATVRGFEMTMDEPKSLGGTNTGMNPVEAMLSAVGGCKVIVAKSFARAHKINLNSIKITVTGDLDTDGFTGKNPEAKIGLMNLHTQYEIDADNTEEEIGNFADFIDATCPVMDTIVNTPNISRDIEIL